MLPKNSCQRFMDKRWQLIFQILEWGAQSTRLCLRGTAGACASAA